ncbi:hypothetical protein ACCW76_20580 [Pantoea sp. C8B4]|uniref:hypothetical protein n=1 Tax=Pantoea sp. C8B4 TaxID=3243083 RepID=UPI003EDA4B3A
MAISRRGFYKLVLGSAAGFAVMKHAGARQAKVLEKIPLHHGAGDKGETQGGFPPSGALAPSSILTIRLSISVRLKRCSGTCLLWQFTVSDVPPLRILV